MVQNAIFLISIAISGLLHHDISNFHMVYRERETRNVSHGNEWN